MTGSAFAEALSALKREGEASAPENMRAAFAEDPKRFAGFSLRLEDLLLDWSKCAVSHKTMALLHALARAANVEQHRDAMFSGDKINSTENRAVLHVALRSRGGSGARVDGAEVDSGVAEVLARMTDFADAVRDGSLHGATGKPFTDIVNIGIGGSDLGPAMAAQALSPYHDGPQTHFVSNIDGAHIADTLKGLDPETTLFVVASKTFTTVETMTNAATARRWLAAKLGDGAVADHFAAISTALDKVGAFGIAAERVFGFWDWVGGRYSVWSAIGLPVMLAIGPENFMRLLDGAHVMDEHFRTAPAEKNMPIVLGLIGYWHRVIRHYPTRAVIPYDQRLARLPAYLQQLDMESNGKRVTINGRETAAPTGPVVWGEPGTNGQHAFFQLLHQGADVIPVEFIAAAEGHEPELKHHHDLLLANCLAQAEALMRGRSEEEALEQLTASGMDEARARELAPHKTFPGNRPSLTILYRKLEPFALGRLLALYEHRVFVEAQLYGINAFDQWGVELGKELATRLLPVVEGKADASAHDGSTAGLVAHIHTLRGRS